MQTKLSFLTKALYGIGDMSTACVVGVIGYLLMLLLLNVAILIFFVSYVFILKFI